jgi:hypothetical protein
MMGGRRTEKRSKLSSTVMKMIYRTPIIAIALVLAIEIAWIMRCDEPVLAAKRARFSMVRGVKPILPASGDAPVLEDVAAGPASFIGDYKPFSRGAVGSRTGETAAPVGTYQQLAGVWSHDRRAPSFSRPGRELCSSCQAQELAQPDLCQWAGPSPWLFCNAGAGPFGSC